MRVKWDLKKSEMVLERRKIDFSQFQDLICLPYIEDQKNDAPEQYRLIGFSGGRLLTFIVEYRWDDIGEYIWIVTAWNSTQTERKAYEKEIR